MVALYPGSNVWPGPNLYPGDQAFDYRNVWLTDDFEVAAANLHGQTASVGTWTAMGVNESVGASSVVATRSGGKLVSTTPTRSQLYYVNASPPSYDYACKIEFLALSNPISSYVTLVARYTATNSFVEAFLLNGTIIRAGVSTPSGAFAFPDVIVPAPVQGETHTLELAVIGSRMFVKYDNVKVMDLRDSRIPLTGFPGAGAPANSAYNSDNYSVTTLVVTDGAPFAAFGIPL